MGNFINFWIKIDKENVNYRFGDEKPFIEEKHQLYGDLESLQQLKNKDEYGKKLFQSLFQKKDGDLREQFEKGIAEGKNFHFRLYVEDPQLESLYWESLQGADISFGRSSSIFLSRSTSTYVLPFDPVQVEKVRVLVVISATVDIDSAKNDEFDNPAIDREKKVSRVKEELKGIDIDFDLMKEPASLKNIRDHLREGYKDKEEERKDFNVLYIISKGLVNDEDSYILLEDDNDKKVAPHNGNSLGEAIEKFKLKLVILSPYQFSKEQSREFTIKVASKIVNYNVPASIALRNCMEYTTEKVGFMGQFFEQLVNSIMGKDNKPIDQIINNLRYDIRFNDNSKENDWVRPVMFMRGDGVLFKIQPLLSRNKIREHGNQETSDFHSFDKKIGEDIYVFCCYSSVDEKYMTELGSHLKTFKNGLISDYFRDKDKIMAGDNYEQIILDELDKADVILLLASVDWENSDFIQEYELPKARKKLEEDKAKLIPIMVGPVKFHNYEDLKKLEHLPKKGSLTSMDDRELKHNMYAIGEQIREAIKDWILKKKITKGEISRVTKSTGHSGLEGQQINKDGRVAESQAKFQNSSKGMESSFTRKKPGTKPTSRGDKNKT